jgi:hypothetical protein
MRRVVNGERRSLASKVLTGALVPRLLIMTRFGRKREAIGGASRRIEELANIGSLNAKFENFCPGQGRFLDCTGSVTLGQIRALEPFRRVSG